MSCSTLQPVLQHWPVPFAPGENLSPLTSDKSQTVIDREVPGIVETWKAVVDIYKNSNKVKAIGVSNFSKKHLDMIIDATGVVPAVNQIEAHPGLQQDELEGECRVSSVEGDRLLSRHIDDPYTDNA
jgi:L-glyceraldehyde reductase